MKRVILFRGKRIDKGEWVEGGFFREPYTDKAFIVCWNSFGLGFIEEIEVDPETVGQYTGLNDKNGKRIFEGDFIHARYVDDSSLTAGVVNFILGCFCVRYNAYNNPAIDTLKEYEVVSNIHDNPELIAEAE